MKICAVYKITNTVTGDFYIGSSKDVKKRWRSHEWPSVWKKNPNKQLYQDMQKYGVDKFEFEIIAEVEEEKLKEKEQQFIEILKPTYNQMNAKGLNVEKYKETKKEYQKSDKGKESHKKANNKYKKSDKGKESNRKSCNKYNNQLCFYNGETLTLNALSMRFWRRGIPHSTTEAKKYLI